MCRSTEPNVVQSKYFQITPYMESSVGLEQWFRWPAVWVSMSTGYWAAQLLNCLEVSKASYQCIVNNVCKFHRKTALFASKICIGGKSWLVNTVQSIFYYKVCTLNIIILKLWVYLNKSLRLDVNYLDWIWLKNELLA